MSTTTENIFQRLWDWITGEVKQLPQLEKDIATFADKVTNDIKGFTSSQLFTYLESGINAVASAINPALVPLLQGIENYIPKAVTIVAGVDSVIDAETSKTLQDQVHDGLTAISNTKAVDAVLYANKLGGIAAGISNFLLTNNAVETGITAPAPGTIISVQQAVHANAA